MRSGKLVHLVRLTILAALAISQVRSQAEIVGEDDSLTAEEQELVAKLRPMVKDLIYKDYMNEDEYLIRFLRVRNYDLEAASDMIAKAMKWRKENKMDTAITIDYPEIESQIPLIFEGHDNSGRPILMASLSVIDIRKFIIAGNFEKFVRFLETAFEMAEAVLREMKTNTLLHRNVTRAYIIVDLSGFNLRQHWCLPCIPFIPRLAATYENYYPDRVYRAIVVNTPRIALPLYDLISPFVSARNLKIVKLFDHDRAKWREFLRSEIPVDQLPTLYGGSAKVIPKTIKQIRESNPYLEAAVKKAFEELKREKEEEEEEKKKKLKLVSDNSVHNIKHDKDD